MSDPFLLLGAVGYISQIYSMYKEIEGIYFKRGQVQYRDSSNSMRVELQSGSLSSQAKLPEVFNRKLVGSQSLFYQ